MIQYFKGIAELGKKAKNNQISIEDMDGGTFTIRQNTIWPTFKSCIIFIIIIF